MLDCLLETLRECIQFLWKKFFAGGVVVIGFRKCAKNMTHMRREVDENVCMRVRFVCVCLLDAHFNAGN